MPTTGHGIIYPDSSGNVNLWEHFQNVADSTEAALDVYEAYASWTPTWFGSSGFTSIGAGGTSEGFYQQIGKLVYAQFRIELGTAPTVAVGTFTLNLPVAGFSWGGNGVQAIVGNWQARDQSATTHFAGAIGVSATGSATANFGGAWSGTVPSSRISDVLPFAWAVTDVLSGNLIYRAA